MSQEKIRRQLQDSADVQIALIQTEDERIEAVANMMIEVIENGGWIFLMGNGGSASDSEHIAAEFVGRYLKDRRPLPAQALTTNSSLISAISNDYGYESVFARQIEAYCSEVDLVVGLSTSGSSANVLNGLRTARQVGCRTVGLTGDDPSKMKRHCDICISVPSHDTPRIQESHIVIGHILCDLVETHLFG